MTKNLITQPIVLFVLVFFSNTLLSQNTTSYDDNISNKAQVIELNEEIEILRNSSNAVSQKNADDLISLAYDIKPTLYCTNKQCIQKGDQPPVRVITNTSAIYQLYKGNSLFKNVQLICIKIEKPEDLNTVLKLSRLSGFPKLKYIYFLSTFKICPDLQNESSCEIEKINGMIQDNGDLKIKIIYTSTSDE